MRSNVPAGRGPQPVRRVSYFKSLYETARSLEKFRIGLNNRIKAVHRSVDILDPRIENLYEWLLEHTHEAEVRIDEELAVQVQQFPVWNFWLSHAKGIGPSLGCHLLAMLLPPLEDRGPSTWYKAAGIVPEERPDGTFRLPRARRGEGRLRYHPWLRRCLWLVGAQFVRTPDSFYREQYDREYARLFALHCWAADRLYQEWRSVGPEARRRWLIDRLGLRAIIFGGADTGLVRRSERQRVQAREAAALLAAPAEVELDPDALPTPPAPYTAADMETESDATVAEIEAAEEQLLAAEEGAEPDEEDGRVGSRILTQGLKAELCAVGYPNGKTTPRGVPDRSSIPIEWFREYVDLVERGATPADATDPAYHRYQSCDAALTLLLAEPKQNRAYRLLGPSDERWELLRVHNTARWAMTRIFLQHLWDKWLEAEGGSSRAPYVIQKLGHTTYYAPPEPVRDGRDRIVEKF